MSIIVTADSSCDLPKQFLDPIPFEVFPLTIIQDGVEYKDNLEITREDIYQRVSDGAPLPSTSAVNLIDYQTRFAALSTEHDAIIHINIGSDISSCHHHAKLAALDHANVYVVDSKNISVGQSLLVMEARRLILEGKQSPAEIAAYLTDLADKVEFTFVLDQLTYLHKGGRCSNMAALGANLLKLKPVIAVQDGKLIMVRKYRGSFEKVITEFFRDQLKDRTDIYHEKTMLVSTLCPPNWSTLAAEQIALYTGNQNPALLEAGCTICSHSGPMALGLALLRK